MGALGLLESGEGPDVSSIRVAHTTALLGSPEVATAWTDGTTTYVNDHSRGYRAAQKGDGVELAAALAHEQPTCCTGRTKPPRTTSRSRY